MNPKLFLWLLTAILLISINLAEAQQQKKISRIGVLDFATPEVTSIRNEAFRQGLRDLGYIEGQNIIIEYRSARGESDRLPELAAELVQLKEDVIVAQNTVVGRALAAATTTIPVVNAGGGDLVASRLAASLARPGGNVTGLATLFPEVSGKQLQRKRIVELAGKYQLPALYFQKGFVDEGGLMSYGGDATELYRRAAVYVDKILKGAKPADLPVQQATRSTSVRQNNSGLQFRPPCWNGESSDQMTVGSDSCQ